MTFSIRYRQAPCGTVSQHWTASFTEAKLHASEVVTRGAADHAEVCDAEGKIVYRFPEIGTSDASTEGTGPPSPGEGS